MESNDLKFSLELARICKAAYAGPINHRRHTYRGENFTHQKIIHGSFGRGYCRVFWNENSVAIAFRGTRESIDWAIANFKAFPVRLRDCSESPSVFVHRGFQRALDYRDKTTGLRSLDATIHHLENYGLLNRQFSITGHSLGGALALLFAVKLRARFPDEFERNLNSIITFASPSVGLQSFEDFYGNAGEKTWRFVNGNDIVPFFPPALFHHVGQEVWLNSRSIEIRGGWQSRLASAAKSLFSGSVSDHAITEYIRALECRISD